MKINLCICYYLLFTQLHSTTLIIWAAPPAEFPSPAHNISSQYKSHTMQMMFLAILILSIAPSHQENAPPQQNQTAELPTFEEFLNKYNLTFPPEEMAFRRQMYESNVTHLRENPCEWCGVTPFFANTLQEMQQKKGLFLPLNLKELADAQKQEKQQQSFFVTASREIKFKLTASSSLNWVDKGAVTPPKSQGSCGTCWSFATVAMCESALILQGRAYNNIISRVDLSEQFILKCTPGSSCSGGYLERALDRALVAGLPYESDYPYYPYSYSYELNYGLCSTNNLVKISNRSRISAYNVDDSKIIEMLQDGPVTAAVGSSGWEHYSSGVYQCPGMVSVDHAVLIVGYTPDYWLLKNSWGTSFGEGGYIRVSRNPNYNCRIGVAVHMIWQWHLKVDVLCFLLLLVLSLW